MISRLLLIPAFFATVFFPCLAAIGRSAEVELPAKLPGGTALWRLVAQSDVIVGGILVVPAEARKVPFDSFKADISLSATVEERLKDAWPRPKLAIKYYASSRADDSVSPEKLQALHAGKIVAFLAVVDDLGEKPELFFAGYTDDALQPSSPELLDQIRKEVAAQAEVQRSFSTSALARPDSHHAAVAALIEEMVSEKTELEAFEKLEALGLAAVPSIIRLLDDRRELPLKQISLRNQAADSFEILRHYVPKTVGEALDAILNQVTGDDFGGSWFYNNLRAHQKSVAGWRIWLAHQKSEDSAAAK